MINLDLDNASLTLLNTSQLEELMYVIDSLK